MALRRRGRESERRGTPADMLVIGLGNPGSDYQGSRHNVGADTVTLLAERHGCRLRHPKGQLAEVDETLIGGKRVALAIPTTYMNESGQAAGPLVRRFGIEDCEQLVIVHDELDLDPGRVRIKVGGGLAGHNGLRSIKAHLKTTDFVRIRIGVGKPPTKERGADHVLRRPSKAVREELDQSVQIAADAVEAILADGPEAAMNAINTR